MSESPHCPLCSAPDTIDYWQDRRRSYRQCTRCELVLVPPQFHLTPVQERAEYDLHQNDPDDEGYRQFLSRLALPLLERLSAGSHGLDFGCGPGPALARMLEESGHRVALYDVFYAPDDSVLAGCYDFITATEVVEHLAAPGAELERLWLLLKPGGWLGVMTKLVRDRDAFAGWHYKKDPTHISFFSRPSWRWWAEQAGAELTVLGEDVVLLQKSSD